MHTEAKLNLAIRMHVNSSSRSRMLHLLYAAALIVAYNTCTLCLMVHFPTPYEVCTGYKRKLMEYYRYIHILVRS